MSKIINLRDKVDFGKINEELTAQVSYNESDNEDLEEFFRMSYDIEVVDERTANQALDICLRARKRKQEILARKSEIQKELKTSLDEAILKIREAENTISLTEDNILAKLYDFYQDRDVHVKTENGSLKSVNKWSFVFSDKKQLPEEYKCADTKAIDEAIKMGVRNIPGVQIFETTELALRIKK